MWSLDTYPRFAVTLLSMFAAALTAPATSQTVTNLYSFPGLNSSGTPVYVAPAQGRDGKLYGTTYGPSGSGGSVFKITTAGLESQLYTFGSDGSNPEAGLTLATDGNFYGATSLGGSSNNGVLFKVSPNGVYTVLHEFAGSTDGAAPTAPPIQASDRNFYGSTSGTGGASTIYKYTSAGFSTVYNFDQAQGQYVIGPLIEGTDGNLYGTAESGGANACGTIFKLTKAGSLIWSYSFPCGQGGALPISSVLQATDGNYYGTTFQGGVGIGCGTVFKLDQKGTVSLLYAFKNVPDGCEPIGLMQGTDGNLYGTTIEGGKGVDGGGGTLFQLTTDGVHAVLYKFGSAGNSPRKAPMQDTNGLFYGTTALGGRSGFGTVYSLDMGLGPFVAFVLPTGKVGQSAQILGQNLTGATSVTFNGVPATTFTVARDTYMTAVVPDGATTGPVVVTTPTGKLTSNVSFRVSK